jgi:hypothetical protein
MKSPYKTSESHRQSLILLILKTWMNQVDYYPSSLVDSIVWRHYPLCIGLDITAVDTRSIGLPNSLSPGIFELSLEAGGHKDDTL